MTTIVDTFNRRKKGIHSESLMEYDL